MRLSATRFETPASVIALAATISAIPPSAISAADVVAPDQLGHRTTITREQTRVANRSGRDPTG